MEPTASSVRCASASGSGSCPALGAKGAGRGHQDTETPALHTQSLLHNKGRFCTPRRIGSRTRNLKRGSAVWLIHRRSRGRSPKLWRRCRGGVNQEKGAATFASGKRLS